jgi:hypothetical protein
MSTDSRLFADFIQLLDQNSFTGRLEAKLVPTDQPVYGLLKNGELLELGDFLIHADKKTHQLGVYYRYKTFNEQKLLKLFPYERDNNWEYFQIPRPFSTEKEKHGFVTQLCLADMQASAKPKLYVMNCLENAFDLIRAREVLANYLSFCKKDTRSQLVVTTSNALLLDKKVFRPDEIWISEPGNYGDTKFLSLSEFRKTVKGKSVWKGISSKGIGGIYTPLLMAALEVN